ncbi:Argonaute siRNA chaperone complex subunit Arb1-domain-containing protein [Hypoxylon trugodes]|uniref:Argonaute siRNA chaperone complex subunit Arb1-domain-containing protein n=1 Tax=Hypoxylon trugodes TaxID=326681 RepID=UPI002193439E|nr:Argonaute siRNA chaperone complex subunit Arb1-domain-containing protein [Hypoxylon trugodes]KAI1386640.1 Argonaute siRNA chaperone complex subunit Arb1-domain-containing protein [Hypoxylon trugodes]
MADLPADSPVESGKVQVTTESSSPQANGFNTVTTTSESISGQSDAHHEGTTTVTATGILSPERECDELSSDEKDANNAPATEGADSKDVDEPIDGAEGDVQPNGEPDAKKKKKKRKKKGGAARKNVTGFEEFYADAPMTPAEAAEEKKVVYSPSRVFSDRIEECIQRYRASRRMDSERSMVFNKYLWLGGIDSSPRQFTGFADDREALEGADKDEIRQMTATDFVGNSGTRFYDPAQADHWFIDFEGIVKGFLSRTIPSIYMYDEPANRQAAETVKNFLNYVLMHDACPEYTDDILAARSICDIAPIELRLTHEIYRALPGDFNATANSLFCDRQVDNANEGEAYENLVTFRVTVFSSLLDDEIKRKLIDSEDPTTIHVVDTKEETYQIVSTTQPHQKDVQMVEERLKELGHPGKGKPAGVIVLKPSFIDHGCDDQCRTDDPNAEPEQYLLESDLLSKFEKGMKTTLVVCELNIGLRFIKEVRDVRVSFDQFLPQMLMENWKDPVPNTRPPPSASNPNAEERALASEDI